MEPKEETEAKWPADHPYSYSIGDIQYKEVVDHRTGQLTKLLFGLNEWPELIESKMKDNTEIELKMKDNTDQPKQKEKKKRKKEKENPPIRKIFVSFKIVRVSNIDSLNEQYRIKFHMYFNWLPTYAEYISYCQIKDDPNATLSQWEPSWYPQLEFLNEIESADGFPRWNDYPGEGKFRMQKLKGFFSQLSDDPYIYHPDDRNIPISERNPIDRFDYNHAYFIRAKLQCDMILFESIELQHFPFDCQDLSLIIQERSHIPHVAFIPEMRKDTFADLDPIGWSIDEWDLAGSVLEFSDLNGLKVVDPKTLRGRSTIILSIKLTRRWKPIFANTFLMLFFISVLSFTVFSIDFQETASRLGFVLTLILTIVLFDPQSTPPPYLTLMDKYILLTYGYLVMVMLENSLGAFFDNTIDDILFYVILSMFLIKNIGFVIYAYTVKKAEEKKLNMGYHQVQKYLTEFETPRPVVGFNYTQRKRTDEQGSILSFFGNQMTAEYMTKRQKAKLQQQKQEKMMHLAEYRATTYIKGYQETPKH
eukprot:157192_1